MSDKELLRVTRRWVDWYGAMRGFRVVKFPAKRAEELIAELSRSTCGYLGADGHEYSLPGGTWMRDHLLKSGRWKQRGMEVLVAQTVDGNMQIKILGAVICHRYSPTVHAGNYKKHSLPSMSEEEFDKGVEPTLKIPREVRPGVFQLSTPLDAAEKGRLYDISLLCVGEPYRMFGIARALVALAIARIGAKPSKPIAVKTSIAMIDLPGYAPQWSPSKKLFEDNFGFQKLAMLGPDRGGKRLIPWHHYGESIPGLHLVLARPDWDRSAKQPFFTVGTLLRLFGKPNAVFCGKQPRNNVFRLPPGQEACKRGLNWLFYRPPSSINPQAPRLHAPPPPPPGPQPPPRGRKNRGRHSRTMMLRGDTSRSKRAMRRRSQMS